MSAQGRLLGARVIQASRNNQYFNLQKNRVLSPEEKEAEAQDDELFTEDPNVSRVKGPLPIPQSGR